MKFRLGKASFVIRKWRTNDEALRNLIQECEGSEDTKLMKSVKVMKRF